MDPLTLTLLIKLAVAAIAVIVVIVILTYDEIINWFRERSQIKEADQDNIAFTLQSKLANGNYKTVQGVFNTDTSRVLEGRTINSRNVDGTVRGSSCW